MEDDLDTDGLSPLQAYDAVRRFAQRAGSGPMRLALHAAMPQVLHADLLHLLRLNFVDDGRSNPVAEADVLFSAFCCDLGHAYYRFDPHARALLLAELDGAFPGERQQRSLQVAEFLLAWFEHERAGERAGTDAMYRSWIEVERWNALAFADPDGAAEQLAAVLQSATAPAEAAARLRVGTLARSLAQPLLRHQPLLDYAAGVQALQTDASEVAQALLRRLGDAPVEVGAVTLPPAGQVLRALTGTRTVAAKAVDAEAADSELAEPVEQVQPVTPTEEAPPEAAVLSNAEPRTLQQAHATFAGTECSAYISYANNDDQVCNGWISDFAKELERGLQARLRGLRLPPLHLSGAHGPESGGLSDAIQARIGGSFSMIVMVHDNYVSSEWALREIETFLAAGNEAAMRERLYIIAMSRPAIERLYANPRWRQLRLDDQVWLPFFGDENPAQPLPMFLKRGILAPGFLTASNRLRDDLAAKLRRAREGSAPADDGGTRPAPARPEADTRSEIAVGDRAGGPGARLSDDTMRQLQAAGLRVLRLTQIDAAVRGAPALARAQRLVLPFDNQPLEGDGGGHLEAISRAWLALGREASSIAWVDMRSPQQALEDVGAARWVIGQGLPTVALADWLRALEPGSEPGPAPIEREAQRRSVRIYIESNAREPDHWRALGDMLQQRWNRDVPEPAPVPRLAVRGLPMDALDSFPSLDDADGVILLWGRKTADALMAQVNRVENRLPPGPIIAPGLVAYLIPPHPPTAEPVPAWGWRVLRFSVEAAGRAIDIADDDARELDRFLRQALETHMRRLARDESSRPA